MIYLLDTDTCIEIIRKHPIHLLQKLQGQSVGSVGVSVITVAELSTGAAKSNHPHRNHEALLQFLLPLEIYAFDYNAAHTYGKIRATLEQQGHPIGSMDMLIAAHALTLGATLVTHNMRHFGRVEGIQIEDWLNPTT